MTPETPDTQSGESGLADYRQHYGLSTDPFQDDSDIPFYGGAQRHALLEQLEHQCQFSASFLVVLGEEGVGKTRLAQELLSGFDEDDEMCSLVAEPGLETATLLTRMADAFKLLHDPEPSEGQLLASLRRFAQSADESDNVALVVIDDAHLLDDHTLTALMTLLQGQEQGGRRLHIVLFAEPHLGDRLHGLQVQDLLVHDFYLEPFSLTDASDYLNFRIEMAGYLGPELFHESRVEPWWHRAQGRLPQLHQSAHQWLLDSVARPTAKRKGHVSKLPMLHIVAIAGLLGVLMMVFLYRGGEEERTENEPELVFEDEAPEPLESFAEETEKPLDTQNPSPSLASSAAETADADGGVAETNTERALGAPNETGRERAELNLQEAKAPLTPVAQPQSAQNEPAQSTAPQEEAKTEPEVIEDETEAAVNTQDERQETAQPEAVESKPEAAPSEPVTPRTLVDLPEDEQVLLSWRSSEFTLQLIAASSEASIRRFVSEQPNREKLLRFATRRAGEDWFVVVAGRYETREQAREAIAQLPDSQQKAGPWPRSLSDIQKEIEALRGL